MITQSSILSSQVKTRMMCLSLPLNQGGPIPQGNVFIPIQEVYLSSFLGITKFLPCKKLTIRLPLIQGPPAAMVRYPAAHEEFFPSMSWISILKNLQPLASQGTDHPSLSSTSHVSYQKVIHQTSLSGPPLCYVAFLRIISKDHTSFLMIGSSAQIHPDKHIHMNFQNKSYLSDDLSP